MTGHANDQGLLLILHLQVVLVEVSDCPRELYSIHDWHLDVSDYQGVSQAKVLAILQDLKSVCARHGDVDSVREVEIHALHYGLQAI